MIVQHNIEILLDTELGYEREAFTDRKNMYYEFCFNLEMLN